MKHRNVLALCRHKGSKIVCPRADNKADIITTTTAAAADVHLFSDVIRHHLHYHCVIDVVSET